MAPLSFFRLFIALTMLSVLLSQCSGVDNHSLPLPSKNVYSFEPSSKHYLTMLIRTTHVDENEKALLHASHLLATNRWQEANHVLKIIKPQHLEQIREKNILLAKIALIQNQPKKTLAFLANVEDVSKLPPYYQLLYHELLANAFHATDNLLASMQTQLKLDSFLNEAEKKTNHQQLWIALSKLPAEEIDALLMESHEPNVEEGWIKLAQIARSYRTASELTQHLKIWQQTYPGHPAQSTVLPLLARQQEKYTFKTSNKHLAVLLPLSGSLAGPGSAIRDGILAAAQTNKTFYPIQFYDTAKKDSLILYHEAIANSADYVIGPLGKKEVASMANIEHPVPTLLLNDPATPVRSNAYRYGLSLSFEARQIAAKAQQQGLSRALVIVPNGTWGNDIAASFKAEWERQGGNIVDELHYTDPIVANEFASFLQITDSQAREKKLKQLLGNKIEVSLSRRQDFDSIFLLAYPSKARQIMPLLSYYFIQNIPIYAPSIIYSGKEDIRRDKDLEGVIFCDMPGIAPTAVAAKNWPEQLNSYNRLYALGRESYALALQLTTLLWFPALTLNEENQTTLYLNQAQQITRIPVWKQFKGGKAQPLANTLPAIV